MHNYIYTHVDSISISCVRKRNADSVQTTPNPSTITVVSEQYSLGIMQLR